MSLPPPAPASIALVTGASSGIGEQYARQLAERGHRVALVARREDRLSALADELGGPERAVVIAADLALETDRDRLAARLDELGVRVEILVNNAGYCIYQSFVESGCERELAQLRVLVEAAVDLIARYLPGMVERRRGDQHVLDGGVPAAALQRRLLSRQGISPAALRGTPRRGAGARCDGHGGLPGPGPQRLRGSGETKVNFGSRSAK